MQLFEKTRKKVSAALCDYDMIKDGDRVLVAVSGGKDSAILALILEDIRRKAKINFTFQAVMLDQKQPGFDHRPFEAWLDQNGLTLTLIQEDTYSIVTDKVKRGKTFCGLCSRLRRGILYNYAHEHGFSKIAFGHHRDDMAETLLLNLFFNGHLSSMPPKLKSDDGRNTVIRPLAYVPEMWLEELSGDIAIPILPCNLCGSQDNLQRAKVKALLRQLEKDNQDLQSSMLKAMQNIRPSQLMDRNLWDFSRFA